MIITDYVGDTVEWNMLFNGCPSGWVLVFTQDCVLLDAEPSLIRIIAADSMLRDCTFVLNDVDVISQLAVNDPDCPTVSTAGPSWGRIKSVYR